MLFLILYLVSLVIFVLLEVNKLEVWWIMGLLFVVWGFVDEGVGMIIGIVEGLWFCIFEKDL